MGKASKEPEFDRTSWMVNSDVAQFLTLHQKEVLYMCMLGYTFMHGSKVFAAAPKAASFSYKLVSMILACTGGGILVPIFLNGIPVPLANDAYPIAILLSFAIHYYFPIVREVVKLSPIVNVSMLSRFTIGLICKFRLVSFLIILLFRMVSITNATIHSQHETTSN